MATLSGDAKSLLSCIRSNRRALRARGLTAADLLTLEALAVKAPTGFARVSVAALGRMTGVTRMTALRHIRRLEAVGAVVRLGPALMVNARSVVKWAADACVSRAAHVKRLFLLRKSARVTGSATHRRQKGIENASMTETDMLVPDRQTCLADLRAMVAARDAARAANAGRVAA